MSPFYKKCQSEIILNDLKMTLQKKWDKVF